MCGDTQCFFCGTAQGTWEGTLPGDYEEEITVEDLEEYYADFLTAMDRADAALAELRTAIARFTAQEAPSSE
jgi:hypothetical protein